MTTEQTIEVTVELDACEPEELFWHGRDEQSATPKGLWLRVDEVDGPGGGWPVVALRGPKNVVREFVRENWGDDALADLDENNVWEN